jgi:hypothetical protein
VRVVVGVNRLQSEESSEDFRGCHRDNRAGLTDYVLIETFKPGRPDEVREAFLILA